MNKLNNREQAVSALNNEQVIVYPTEAVWGMGCNPQSKEAVEHLLAIKQRPVSKGLILIAGQFSQVERYIDISKIPAEYKEDVFNSWPGPVTWLLPCSEHTPSWISGGSELVAVRITAHPTVIALCELFGNAIVSTSANLTGQPTSNDLAQLQAEFKDSVAVYVNEPLGGNTNPSTIKNAITGQRIRG